MKKIVLFGVFVFCTAAVYAGPHCGRRGGVREIVHLAGAAVNAVTAVICPHPVVVHTAPPPPPPPCPVVIHHAPPPPPVIHRRGPHRMPHHRAPVPRRHVPGGHHHRR